MGLFDFLKKPKSDLEQYYEERNARTANAAFENPGFENAESGQGAAAASFSGFRFTVEDVFAIAGRGTVVTGRVASGSVNVGDSVTLQRLGGSTAQTVVTGIEMFRKVTNVAQEGDNVGILLRGLSRNDVGKGDVLVK